MTQREEKLILRIQKHLTTDLLKPLYRNRSKAPFYGHCYTSTEALFYLLGGKNKYFRYQPCYLRHNDWKRGLKPNTTHWFLRKKSDGSVLDPTVQQFLGKIPPYQKGRVCWVFYSTWKFKPSRTTTILLERITNDQI